LKIKKKYFFIIFLLLGFAGALSAHLAYGSLMKPVIFDKGQSGQEAVIFEIKKGTSFRKLARQLKQQNLIPNQRIFVLYGLLQGKADKIQAGQYELSSGRTPLQLLDQFIKGDVIQYKFSIIEGWDFRQLLTALSENEAIENTLKDLEAVAIMEHLGYEGIHPEGRFFADTYTFPNGTSDMDFLQRAYQKMEQVLAEEWSQREENLPYANAYEALIMASIIEKETGLASERDKISGVFVRRLKKKMRLQTDPTVIYGIGSAYKGNLTRKHLVEKTPYNTYRISGLPPTPIAMPGREAIHAALHPASGSSLYFVAKGDGSHFFSESLAEHSSAVKKYQWKPVKNYRSAPKK